MAKSKSRSHSSDDKEILSAKESFPPPRYSSGRQNDGFESDDQTDNIKAPPRIQSKAVKPYSRSSSWEQTDSVKPLHSYEIDYNHHKGTVRSICLCSASVYPHYHGETIIDNEVYDEILIVDPKELHTVDNKEVRLKGQCLRLCKLAIIIIIVFAGLACGLYGVAHYFIVNKASFAMMGKADVKLLQYSTYFCERIATAGANIERKLTVLQRKAANIAAFNHNETRVIQLGSDQRTYEHAFYAIEQSVLKITVVTKEDVQIMVFDDKDKLSSWKNNKNYPSYKFRETCCKSVIIGRGIYSFTTKQDKQAFLVIYVPTPIPASVNITLNFQRNFLDYKRSTETCSADQKASCSVPVSFSSKDKVVIEVPRTSKAFDSRKVEWNCEARVWFYVLVFVGIFIAIVIIMSLVYCIFKYCICNACCCFCCYIVPHNKKSPQVVQYHKHTANKQRAAYLHKASTPKGPRAEHMKELKRYDSSDSIDKRAYYTSDTSDDQGLNSEERRLQRKQARRMSSTNSTATSHSFASTQFSRRRSSSSIGSDIKRGFDVDDSYEELPDYERKRDRNGHSERRNHGKENGAFVIDVNDSVDGRVVNSNGHRRGDTSSERRQRKSDEELDARLRRKLELFTDSEEDEEDLHHVSFDVGDGSQQRKTRAHSARSQRESEYDVVGSEIYTPSQSTASAIDALPLGPSGAPPTAPPKSEASIKGKPDFHKHLRSVEIVQILPNGLTRDKQGGKLKKTRSDAVARNGVARKHSPVTANVIVLNGEDKRSADIYSTYQRGRKNDVKDKTIYNRTISLDSGLDKIEGSNRDARRKIRPAADVKF